jgi:hypothetical protein
MWRSLSRSGKVEHIAEASIANEADGYT